MIVIEETFDDDEFGLYRIKVNGKDDEWNEVGENVFQNNRVSSVFKDGKSKAYYLDAIIWKTQSGSTWNGNAEEISSRQYIKSFPFTPKTFYVDVIEKKISEGNFDFEIKDKKQLKPVSEYYDMEI